MNFKAGTHTRARTHTRTYAHTHTHTLTRTYARACAHSHTHKPKAHKGNSLQRTHYIHLPELTKNTNRIGLSNQSLGKAKKTTHYIPKHSLHHANRAVVPKWLRDCSKLKRSWFADSTRLARGSESPRQSDQCSMTEVREQSWIF